MIKAVHLFLLTAKIASNSCKFYCFYLHYYSFNLKQLLLWVYVNVGARS